MTTPFTLNQYYRHSVYGVLKLTKRVEHNDHGAVIARLTFEDHGGKLYIFDESDDLQKVLLATPTPLVPW